MKHLLCLLAAIWCTASAATAGPNQGGVLWAHDTGVLFSTDLTLPPVTMPPADCAGVDSQQEADGVERVWKVYAAFPPGSHPRLKTCGWAIQFPEAATSPLSYVGVTGGGIPDEDGPGTDFFVGDLGFPTASGGQIGQSFPLGPRTTTVVLLFYFHGFGYHASGPFPIWTTAEHNAPGNRIFGDDATPTNEDPIMGYGSLGFGAPGTTPCPIYDPDAVCCAPTGTCTITKQAACAAPRVWFPDWFVCTPNPCPPPTGACCVASGACSMLTPAACANSGGAFYDDLCVPNPCPQPGACCLPNGACLMRQPAACASAAGTFYDGPCTPNPCPQPSSGACCFAAGACSMLTPATCGSSGGAWYDGACEPNPCPQPGACCFPTGACSMLTPAACAGSGGVPDDGTCEPNPCPQPPPPGTGDTIADPFFVTTPLPFTGTGTTVGYNDDYEEICPYGGNAPDVVYAYAADGASSSLNIDLCYSSYDTKVYVYDSIDLVNPIACNDDYYFTPPCYTYSSYLGQVSVVAGHTYYIVVDGYGSSSGDYVVTVTDGGFVPPPGACCAPDGTCTVSQEDQCAGTWQGASTNCYPNPCPQPPPLTCPEGSLVEGEPLCQDNYTDNYNGGCGSTPVVWQSLAPQAASCAVMCGRACTYVNGGTSNRDTDWYMGVGCGQTVTYIMTADFVFMQALFTGVDCGGLVYSYNIGQPGETSTLTANIGSGIEVGFFAAPADFAGHPDEGTYIMNVCGICEPPPPPAACCDAAGACIVATPEACAFMGGVFHAESPACEPSPCGATPTVSTSWGTIKARFLDPVARPQDARRSSRTSRPVAATPAPAATVRSSGCSVPDFLGTRRPPKPGSVGPGGGK